jgi:hypothetical protein
MITGNKNANTVAIDSKFLTISGENQWSWRDVEEFGHELISVTIRGARYGRDTDRNEEIILSHYGSELRARLRHRNLSEVRAVELGAGEEFDKNVTIIVRNMRQGRALNGFVIKVVRMVTKNKETGQLIDWRTKQSSVIILKDDLYAYAIDNKKYTDMSYMDVITAAGFMACKECNYTVGAAVKGQDKCVFTGKILKRRNHPIPRRVANAVAVVEGV